MISTAFNIISFCNIPRAFAAATISLDVVLSLVRRRFIKSAMEYYLPFLLSQLYYIHTTIYYLSTHIINFSIFSCESNKMKAINLIGYVEIGNYPTSAIWCYGFQLYYILPQKYDYLNCFLLQYIKTYSLISIPLF